MALPQHYACQCLNIRITGETASSEVISGSFFRVKARDEDVQVSIPHFTIRKRTHEGDANERIHYTTMTCLLCQTLAYRVQVQNPADEGPDGPVLSASAEWSDREPLRSKDSWLQVSNRCQSGTIYMQMLSSPDHSTVFSLLVPLSGATSPSVSPIQKLSFAIPSLAADLPPLFLAPPFTPAHPVFQALSRYAIRASDDLRKKVDMELESFLQTKLKELELAEETLRKETDILWKRWRAVWDEVKKEDDKTSKQQRTQSGPAPIISEFNPDSSLSSSRTTIVETGAQPQTTSRSVAPPSLLSASLAQTSSIHQHMALAAIPPTVASPILEGISPPPRPDSALGRVVLTDDSFAVAASFRLAMADDEATVARMEKAQARRLEKAKATHDEVAAKKVADKEKEGAQVSDRGRGNGSGTRRVQFAESSKGEASEVDEDEPSPEIPMFDIEELLDYGPESSRETSLTPIPASSPRSESTGLAPGQKSGKLKEGTGTLVSANSAIKTQMKDVVGAHLPSHRSSWGANFNQPQPAWSTDRDSSGLSAEDVDATATDSSRIGWQNPSAAATSLPVTMGSHMQNGVARPSKSSLADQPASVQTRTSNAPNGYVSSSLAARERVYAVRDMASTVDPGPTLSIGPETIEEEEEEEEEEEDAANLNPGLIGEAKTPGEKLARRILQKSRQSGVPDSGMWRSFAG
ncbi:hypothetical protein FRB95_000184 [Tulasnella sp. JGI-2019a]|nr:hypothetical protein FRB95_000184 [Tulasnella sp. JGI-2019a]